MLVTAAAATALKFLILFQDSFSTKASKVSNRFCDCSVLFAIFLPPAHTLSLSLSRRTNLIPVFLFHILYACVCMVIYEFCSLFFQFFLFGYFLDRSFHSQFNFTLLSVSRAIGCVYRSTCARSTNVIYSNWKVYLIRLRSTTWIRFWISVSFKWMHISANKSNLLKWKLQFIESRKWWKKNKKKIKHFSVESKRNEPKLSEREISNCLSPTHIK